MPSCVTLSHTPPSPRVVRYIVFPFYDQTLKRYFDKLVADSKRPSEREVLLILVQLCQALVHLLRHRVVHRDLKVCVCVLEVRLCALLSVSLTQPLLHHHHTERQCVH